MSRDRGGFRDLRTGELARAAGVSAETLRYYERRGLLRPSRRTPGGDRRYDDEGFRVVRFIRRAQRLGFSLAAISEFLSLRMRDAPCPEVRAIAKDKIREIAGKRRELAAIQSTLVRLVRACDAGDRQRCPILKALLADVDPLHHRLPRRR
jgi:DNA-binding transcriptional MerR regulator